MPGWQIVAPDSGKQEALGGFVGQLHVPTPNLLIGGSSPPFASRSWRSTKLRTISRFSSSFFVFFTTLPPFRRLSTAGQAWCSYWRPDAQCCTADCGDPPLSPRRASRDGSFRLHDHAMLRSTCSLVARRSFPGRGADGASLRELHLGLGQIGNADRRRGLQHRQLAQSLGGELASEQLVGTRRVEPQRR